MKRSSPIAQHQLFTDVLANTIWSQDTMRSKMAFTRYESFRDQNRFRIDWYFSFDRMRMKRSGPIAQHQLFTDVLANTIWSQDTMRSKMAFTRYESFRDQNRFRIDWYFSFDRMRMKRSGPIAQHQLFTDVLADTIWSQDTMRSKMAFTRYESFRDYNRFRIEWYFCFDRMRMKYPVPEAQHQLFTDVLANTIWSQDTMKSKMVFPRSESFHDVKSLQFEQ